MNQPFYFRPSMTHTFLKYAELMNINNQNIRLLISDLRKGLSEEDILQGQAQYSKLNCQKQKNVLICECIMLHVQCLADICDDSTPYDCFVNGWNNIVAS